MGVPDEPVAVAAPPPVAAAVAGSTGEGALPASRSREIVRVRGAAGGNTEVADPVTVAAGVVVSTLSLELDETAVVVAVAVGRAE